MTIQGWSGYRGSLFYLMTMDKETQQQLIDYLRDFTTEERWEKIEQVLSQRTNHITVVLEDLHKPHNANAVLRSCDGFGVQDVHIIENLNEFDTAGTVSIGAHQWLTLHRYNNPKQDNVKQCFAELKSQGYQIIATTPHEKDSNLSELDISTKTALVFGTELNGVSDRVMELADGYVKIPMYGFSESFNISVSAAVCLYDLTTRLRAANNDSGLSEYYKQELRRKWLKKTIKAGKKLEERFFQDQGEKKKK